MGERAQQTNTFPEPNQLVGAFQTYLRHTPGAPEYGAIGGRGHDRVVYGPLFTSFVLAKTCELQGDPQEPAVINEQAKTIHAQTMSLRFDSGRIKPSIGREVLREYAQRRLADPHVEVARRLAAGLNDRDHESYVIAGDVQVLLSRVALDGGFGEVLSLPETAADSLQAPIPDVA